MFIFFSSQAILPNSNIVREKSTDTSISLENILGHFYRKRKKKKLFNDFYSFHENDNKTLIEMVGHPGPIIISKGSWIKEGEKCFRYAFT